jgi:hypothetical protein
MPRRRATTLTLTSPARGGRGDDECPQALEKKLTKIAKATGHHLLAIFFDIDNGDEVERVDADDVYELVVTLVYSTIYDSIAAKGLAEESASSIQKIFLECCQTEEGFWQHIELVDIRIVADEALTYAQSLRFKPWGLDHISLRSDPQDPFVE